MAAQLAPEIIWFTPSESYLTDPINTLHAVNKSSSDRGLLGLVVCVPLNKYASDSLLSVYHGIEEQDPSIGVWVMGVSHSNFFYAFPPSTSPLISLALSRHTPIFHGT